MSEFGSSVDRGSPSNHTCEDIHEHSDRDEAAVEADVGDITDPDLIWMRDLKGLKQVAPRFIPLKRSGGSTRTLDRDPEMHLFHQPSNALIPNGGPFSHPHLRDTSIPICWIRRCQSQYFSASDVFRGVAFGLIREGTLVETQRLTNLSHGIRLAQCLNETVLLRWTQSKSVNAFFSISIARVNRPTSCSS